MKIKCELDITEEDAKLLLDGITLIRKIAIKPVGYKVEVIEE